MSEATPAEKIRALMSKLLTLPELSKRAGEEVKVLIRVVSAEEFLDLVRDLPTTNMSREERKDYLEGLDPEARAQFDRRSIETDERLIALSILEPRVALEDKGEPGTIPITSLRPDRLYLVHSILDFSGLLAEPTREAGSTEQRGSPSPNTLPLGEGKGEGTTGGSPDGDSFRGRITIVGDFTGDGGAVEPPAIRDPGKVSG